MRLLIYTSIHIYICFHIDLAEGTECHRILLQMEKHIHGGQDGSLERVPSPLKCQFGRVYQIVGPLIALHKLYYTVLFYALLSQLIITYYDTILSQFLAAP